MGIGVFIHATRAICHKITECGIIDEEPTSSKTVEITTADGGVGVGSRRSSLIQFKDLDRLKQEFGESIRGLELNAMDFEIGEEEDDDADDADADADEREETTLKK